MAKASSFADDEKLSGSGYIANIQVVRFAGGINVSMKKRVESWGRNQEFILDTLSLKY